MDRLKSGGTIPALRMVSRHEFGNSLSIRARDSHRQQLRAQNLNTDDLAVAVFELAKTQSKNAWSSGSVPRRKYCRAMWAMRSSYSF